MSIQEGDASHRRVSPLTNSGLLPSVHFCTKWSSLACAFFLPSFLQPVPRCSQTVGPARKPRSLLGNIAKGAAASPDTPASASSTSAASGHQWNFCETWQQRTVTRNSLIYRVIHKSGRICISSYAAKLLVVSPEGAALHSKVRKRPGWWNGKFTLFWMLATCLSKGWHPLPPTNSHWASTFKDRGRGLHAETAQSALTVNL